MTISLEQMAVVELKTHANKIEMAAKLATSKGGILLAYSVNDVVLVDLGRGFMPFVSWLYDTYSNSFIAGDYSRTLEQAKTHYQERIK